ncbi:hypothetical protein AZH53_04770 [Methanomicrobiaceae archaeon CYW5]|uniref:ROK family protein n=1 Tax=Methanovulcanius yangii TaxID=1789227 RepID=UPI0029CA2B59|nr:ROK family protein [Methanovulcanius yangii]MBT8507730.1 hypothetical protein [Methanovulcanius yangii]
MNEKTRAYDVIAVDIGATHLRTARISASGTLHDLKRQNLCTTCRSAEEITRSVVTAVGELLGMGRDSPATAIGIAAAGPLNSGFGAIVGSPNMPYARIDLTDPLQEAVGLPVYLLNDCTAGALGETSFGPFREAADLVYITMSTGIGAGVIAGGHPMTGNNGNAAEVGHMCVDTTFHLPCGCGGRGHWEAYASGTGIPPFFRRWCDTHLPGRFVDDYPSSAPAVFEAVRDSQELEGFLDALAVVNGRGLSNVIAAFEPEHIVLDGPLIREHADLLLGPMLDATDRYLTLPTVTVSTMEGFSPLFGAAAFALKKSGLFSNMHGTL